MNGVNLIPTVRRQSRRRRTRLRRWAIACIGYGLMLGAGSMAVKHVWAGRPEVAGELAAANARGADLNNQITRLRRELAEVESSRQTMLMVTQQPDWSILLAKLGTVLDEQTVLREVKLAPARTPTAAQQPEASYLLELRGLGKEQSAVSQFVSRLQQTGLFDDVRLVRTGREPFLNGAAVSFEVACEMK
jgi:Tfp pilus assembly protein PilN